MELTGDDLVGEVNGENSVQSCEEVPELRKDDSAESFIAIGRLEEVIYKLVMHHDLTEKDIEIIDVIVEEKDEGTYGDTHVDYVKEHS